MNEIAMGPLEAACWCTRHPRLFGFWIRLMGYGVAIDNHEPLFSERHGYKKVIRIFGLRVRGLKP